MNSWLDQALPLRGFQRHPRLHFLAAGFLIVVGILSVLMVIMLGGADLLGGEATARDMALFPLLWYLLLAVPAFRLANGRWRIISGANTKSCWRVHPATVGRVAVVSPLLVGLVLTLQAMSDIALG